ncbi:MAG: oligopeptide/dipeptide ABC transporter ATP-binding protein, partial [Pseudomonadota bacterium]
YTRGLLNSLPHKSGERLKPIQGMVPPVLSLPRGCKFNTRCEHVFDACLTAEPDLINVQETCADKHLVRCWLYQK